MQATSTANRDPNATVVGRLKPGVTLAEAQAEMKIIAERYRVDSPRAMAEGESVYAEPYQEILTAGRARLLWILLGAVSFLLLIACANVANLQLARATARHSEFAVRAALGGSLVRLARQLAIESLVISLVAGALGLAISALGTRALVLAMPDGYLPGVAEVTLDWRVFAFAAFASISAGLVSALAPIAQVKKVDLATTLKEGAGKGGTGRGRMRAVLVVAEVALSVTLLAGAGLLTRTFANLLAVAPGFDPANVVTFEVTPAGPRYDTSAKVNAFYSEALGRMARLPGATSAALVNKLPLDWQFNLPVVFSDAPDKPQGTQVRMISPDYFKVMSIPVRQGRPFADTDDALSPGVVVVNQAFATRYLTGPWPFKRILTVGRGMGEPSREVVGVVGDSKQIGLGQRASPTVFIPAAQVTDRLMNTFRAFTRTHITIKTTADLKVVVDAARREIAALDPTLAVSGVTTMVEVTRRSVAPERFNMLLIGLFGGVALVLALGGVYGVISYGVARQVRELGVRMALGASRRDVHRLIVGQGLRLTGVGLVVGLMLFAAVSGVMKSLLFEVGARDPGVLLVTGIALLTMAGLASYVPARRAGRLDPMLALRTE
jgi:predicted permease